VPDNPPACVRRPVGAHAPVSGGLAAGALRYAAAVGAEAIQVFVSNPRGWAQAPGDAAQDAALREHAAEAGLPVFVHAPYLINAGSPDRQVQERSAASIRHSLRRGAEIGACGVVVHTGSSVDGDRPAALRRVAQCLLPLLDEIGECGPDLLLEPMAGQGQMLCSAVPDLLPYLDALDWHPRANICLDTCHLFAAGHDLAAPGGVSRLLEEFHAAAGGPQISRLRLIHANDSRDPCGSRKDRHERIGRGQIGMAAFASLLSHAATAGVPFIVETPGGEQGQASDVTALRAWRDGRSAAGQPAGHSGGGQPVTAPGPRPAVPGRSTAARATGRRSCDSPAPPRNRAGPWSGTPPNAPT
jgi:deoxyribonuclease IV